MKLKTVLLAATAAGIGYVFGTKAGRARFEQIRGQAQEFLASPTVQDTVANLSDTVKQNAPEAARPGGRRGECGGRLGEGIDRVPEETPSTSSTPPTSPTPPTTPTPPPQ